MGIVTSHIREMQAIAYDLAHWAHLGEWPLHSVREDIMAFAEAHDPRYALDYAAALSRHAAAELEMEAFQSLGWPAV